MSSWIVLIVLIILTPIIVYFVKKNKEKARQNKIEEMPKNVCKNCETTLPHDFDKSLCPNCKKMLT